MKLALLLSLAFILASTPALAEITNPQMVDTMKAEVVESGVIKISGSVNSIHLNLSIPQEDSYQIIEKFEVYSGNGLCRDSCSYRFIDDYFGNRILSINWKDPTGDISFEVKSTVSVSRRFSSEKREYPEFLMPTDLVQTNDQEISSISSGARGSEFEKVSYLSKWINENIKYNSIYSDVNMPAKEILRLKIGVCKEFSNLLVSFLRNIGYYSAVDVGYVHPGKVYTGGNFQPHGWVESYGENGGILSDPTWGEVGYLDATHIKFATLPDSSWTFSSAYSTGFGNFNVDVLDTNVAINVINYDEKNVLEFESAFLEDNIGGGYAVMRTDLKSDNCVLTKLDIRSCSYETGQFLEKINTGDIAYFCGNKSVFTIFRIPELQPGVQYTCPISVFVYGSEQKNVFLTMSSSGTGSTSLSVDKATAYPNERIRAVADESHIFTVNGDSGYGMLDFNAPYSDFTVYSYNKGALDQQRISVVSIKPIEAVIIAEEKAEVGKESTVSVSVRNLASSPQIVSVKFGGNIQTETVDDSRVFSFTFVPQGENDNVIQAVISTSDFSTSLSKHVQVLGDQSILGITSRFFGGVAQAISGFFGRIYAYFD